ncbi:MAG: hypothetical protein WB392_13155, partial [Methanotrichaceae archaeon]
MAKVAESKPKCVSDMTKVDARIFPLHHPGMTVIIYKYYEPLVIKEEISEQRTKRAKDKNICSLSFQASMIDIAIPKGSLLNQTLQLFEQAGLEIKRTEREYNARIADPRIGKVKILRPQEIPA